MTAEDRTVRIRVRLFARQRELAGAREVALELTTGATIEDAWSALAAQVPAIASGDDEPAGDDPVIRRFELWADPFPATLARELADAVATPADGIGELAGER